MQPAVITVIGLSPAAGAKRAGGKSGLHRAGCRRNSCECKLRESAAEKKPPASAGKGEKAG